MIRPDKNNPGCKYFCNRKIVSKRSEKFEWHYDYSFENDPACMIKLKLA